MYKFCPELKDRMVFFMKFSNELWTLESLRDGKLYMNTIGYYRALEEKTKRRGMGDKDEGSLILNSLNISMYDNETGKLFLEGSAKRSELKFEDDLEKHAFCMCYLDFNNLEIIEVGSGHIKAKMIFPEAQKKEFKKNFGNHVLVYSCGDFIENIKRCFGKQKIIWDSRIVRYSDFTVNYIDRIESFINNGSDKFFWKDIFFKEQKEYRVIALNIDSNEPIAIKIDNMERYSHLTTADKLFNGGYCIEMRFDPEKYLIKLD